MFDPGGCSGCLRDCPFLGGRHAFCIGWASLDATMVAEVVSFLVHEGVNIIFKRGQAVRYAVRIAVDRCFPRSQADTEIRQSPTARRYVSCGDTRITGNAIERGA